MYELVPEAFRQRFQGYTKTNQTFEFARDEVNVGETVCCVQNNHLRGFARVNSA